MTPVLIGLCGYLVGSIPTAGLLAGMRGVDLRSEGSGNPGTANALRISGPPLAALVLLVEGAKGFVAVWLGHWLGYETGAVAAGLGAVAGNVYNVWYGFEGGKGLGISLGVLAGLWPAVLAPVVIVITLAAAITKSAGLASLVAVAALVVSSVTWTVYDWPTGGIEPTTQLFVVAIGIGLLIFWKHWRDSPLSSHAPRSRSGRESLARR